MLTQFLSHLKKMFYGNFFRSLQLVIGFVVSICRSDVVVPGAQEDNGVPQGSCVEVVRLVPSFQLKLLNVDLLLEPWLVGVQGVLAELLTSFPRETIKDNNIFNILFYTLLLGNNCGILN